MEQIAKDEEAKVKEVVEDLPAEKTDKKIKSEKKAGDTSPEKKPSSPAKTQGSPTKIKASPKPTSPTKVPAEVKPVSPAKVT